MIQNLKEPFGDDEGKQEEKGLLVLRKQRKSILNPTWKRIWRTIMKKKLIIMPEKAMQTRLGTKGGS